MNIFGFITGKSEVNYSQLIQLLAQGEWRKADEETNRIMCKIMGREREGVLKEKDCKYFPREKLEIIDDIWVKYSNGKFGFSVQKKIFVEECGGTPNYNYDAWCKLGDAVGWRKEDRWLDYSRYTFNTNAPKGHLPGLGGWMWGLDWYGFKNLDYKQSKVGLGFVDSLFWRLRL